MDDIVVVEGMLDRLFKGNVIKASEIKAWDRIKALAQQTNNKQSTPCDECIRKICSARGHIVGHCAVQLQR